MLLAVTGFGPPGVEGGESALLRRSRGLTCRGCRHPLLIEKLNRKRSSDAPERESGDAIVVAALRLSSHRCLSNARRSGARSVRSGSGFRRVSKQVDFELVRAEVGTIHGAVGIMSSFVSDTSRVCRTWDASIRRARLTGAGAMLRECVEAILEVALGAAARAASTPSGGRFILTTATEAAPLFFIYRRVSPQRLCMRKVSQIQRVL